MKSIGLALAFACGLVVGGCASKPRMADSPNDHEAGAAQIDGFTVALVETRMREGDEVPQTRPFCSGVWVSPSLILTAAHCVIDEASLDDKPHAILYAEHRDLVSEDRHVAFTSKAYILDMDVPHDLALLRSPSFSAHPFAHVAYGVTQGQFTQTMGHPLGFWWSYSTGVVAAVRHFTTQDEQGIATADDMTWVQTDAAISPGSSGGGLYDERGDLLGICHGHYPRGELVNVFVHRDHIAAFLRGYGLSQ